MNSAVRQLSGLAVVAAMALAACGGGSAAAPGSAAASSAAPAGSAPAPASSAAAAKPSAAGSSAARASAGTAGAASSAGGSAASAGGLAGSAGGSAASAGGAVASAGGAAASASGAASSATGSAASGAAAAGGNKAPIKIGFVEPLTGPQGIVGKDNNDGFSLYLDSVGGTMAGRKIQPIFVDSQLQADTGLTKAKQLVQSDKVSALMGFTFTPVTYATATYVQTAHVPMLVTGNATGAGLTIDPKLDSPYLMRFTENNTASSDTAADWAYKQGFRKAILMTYDTAAGIENSDLMGSAFIHRGGSVVQEIHPPAGTNDYGSYLATLNSSADILFEFAPGIDGLRFLQQFADYGGAKHPLFFDLGAVATGGPNLGQLKDKAVGVVANQAWVETLDNPANQAFLKAFHAKYPSRAVSNDLAMGWASGQILQAALEKVNGNVEDTQAFLKALYATDVQAPKGEVKLDPHYHDISENYYTYKIAKQGSSYVENVTDTYKDVGQFWDRTPAQLMNFPFGKLKGTWVGKTKAEVDQKYFAGPAASSSASS